jgi:hypothetical protein
LEGGSGNVYHAPDNLAYRRQIRQENCPSCQMSCLFFVSLRKEVFPYLSFITKRLLSGDGWRWRKSKTL